MHPLHVGNNFKIREPVQQNFFGNGTRGDPANCFSRRRATPALPIPDAILCLVRIICVGGSKRGLHLAIGFGTRGLIAYHYRDRRPQSESIKHPGENLTSILFCSLRHDFALSWSSSIEFQLEVGLRKGDPWRTSIDDGPHTTAV